MTPSADDQKALPLLALFASSNSTLPQEESLIDQLGFKGGDRLKVTKRMDSTIPRKTEKKDR